MNYVLEYCGPQSARIRKQKFVVNIMFDYISKCLRTSYLTCSYLHSTTPVDPAASRANLSLHSPDSMRTAARFLPKNTFSRYENSIGPSKSAG